MLMITHACNLNCTYCYESFKSSNMMDSELAKSILLKELEFIKNSTDFDELEVDFMGGEPLLNFSLIKHVVEWFENINQEVPYVFFTTTNGTLMTNEIETWIRLRKNRFIMSLSYDGTPEMQMENRGKNNMIRPIFFKETWPFQPLKMTLSQETLSTFASGVIALQRQGYAVDAVLAQGISWTKKDAKEFRNQLSILKEFYLCEREFKPIDILAKSLKGLCLSDQYQCKFCGSGTHMITYDTDGEAYPCHMFTPLVLGKHALKLSESTLADTATLSDSGCDPCILRQWCPTCYGFNLRYRNNLHERDKTWCIMMQEHVQAVCEFQIEYYHQRIDELKAEDMLELEILINASRLIHGSTSIIPNHSTLPN